MLGRIFPPHRTTDPSSRPHLVRQPRHPVIASVRAGARLVAVVCVRTWAGGRLAVMPQECAVSRHIQWVPLQRARSSLCDTRPSSRQSPTRRSSRTSPLRRRVFPSELRRTGPQGAAVLGCSFTGFLSTRKSVWPTVDQHLCPPVASDLALTPSAAQSFAKSLKSAGSSFGIARPARLARRSKTACTAPAPVFLGLGRTGQAALDR